MYARTKYMLPPPKSLTPTNILVVGVDPDGKHTAACVLSSGPSLRLTGGGTRRDGTPLCSVTGILAFLDALPRLPDLVIVETQPPNSPWSASVEGCRRARFHWEASSELRGVTYRGASPRAWQGLWSPSGKGREYRAPSDRRAATLGVSVANEDQAAALGVAAYGAHVLGWKIDWAP